MAHYRWTRASSLRSNPMRWASIFYRCRSLHKKLMLDQWVFLQLHPATPKAVRGSHTDHTPIKGKDVVVEKARAKVAKRFCQSSCWAATMSAWILMVGVYVSIIRLVDAMMQLTEQNVHEDGICVHAKAVTLLTLSKGMTPKRGDS